MTTKTAFIAGYREKVETAGYDWTKVPGRVDKFMAAVADTLDGTKGTPWAWNASEAARIVWREIGMKGPMTLKGLRALPA